MKKISTSSSAKVMEILEFVKLDDMDPLYFDSSYYVAPEDAGVKAYKLLMSAMKESGYGAIAKLTMHQREHIVILRPGSRGMTLHTMFYSNEIRAAESVPTDKVELKGLEVTEVAQPHLAPVIDLMEALKKSLAEKQAPPAAVPGPVAVGKKPPARAVEAVATVQKKGKKVA